MIPLLFTYDKHKHLISVKAAHEVNDHISMRWFTTK